jgi:hypothetical protein
MVRHEITAVAFARNTSRIGRSVGGSYCHPGMGDFPQLLPTVASKYNDLLSPDILENY